MCIIIIVGRYCTTSKYYRASLLTRLILDLITSHYYSHTTHMLDCIKLVYIVLEGVIFKVNFFNIVKFA